MVFESWNQFGMWLAGQFPVAAFCCFCVWYIIRWTDGKHEQALKRADDERDRQLAEKDKLIARQDEFIRELKAEKEKLMVLRFPSWGRGSEGGGTTS